jgi:hypothetical protein
MEASVVLLTLYETKAGERGGSTWGRESKPLESRASGSRDIGHGEMIDMSLIDLLQPSNSLAVGS